MTDRGEIGVKLDFKQPEAVLSSLRLLREKGDSMVVWLNADVLRGPSGHLPRFNADTFIRVQLPLLRNRFRLAYAIKHNCPDISSRDGSPLQLFQLCQQYFPTGVLSLGWTVGRLPAGWMTMESRLTSKDFGYSPKMVQEMSDLVQRHDLRDVTFSVQALHLPRSLRYLR